MSVTEFLKGLPGFQEMVEAAQSAADEGDEEAAAKLRDEFAACVECAYVIAMADGELSEDEMSAIGERMEELTDGQVKTMDAALMTAGAQTKIDEMGQDGLLENIAERLDSEEKKEAAFIVGANAAWGGGVGTEEGLAMQAVARAFGWEIGHMHQLLAKARG